MYFLTFGIQKTWLDKCIKVKYCLVNRDKLLQHLQMQLSEKEKTFSRLFFAFSKFKFSFDHFEKK